MEDGPNYKLIDVAPREAELLPSGNGSPIPAQLRVPAERVVTKIIVGVHNGHNAAAAVVRGGVLVFALQEERLTRIKNQGGLPERVLAKIGHEYLGPHESHREMPFALGGTNRTASYWRREDLIRSAGMTSYGLVGQAKRLGRKNSAISDAINQRRTKKLENEVGALLGLCDVRATGIDHHLCHAAAAYFGWGKKDEKVLLLTCDGSGDGVCATVNIGERGKIQTIAATEESHSIGTLYATVTYLFGMVPMEHEYKLMGLAPYTEKSPESRAIANQLHELFEVDTRNPMVWHRNNKCPPLQLSSGHLATLLQRRRFDHVAGGVQLFVEEFLVRWVRSCIRATGIRKVALSGGVFMNVKANQRILSLPEVEELFVFPSCGDETNAMGAAWLLHQNLFAEAPKPLCHLYLGTDYNNHDIEAALHTYRFREPVHVDEEKDIEQSVASLLSRNKIVARFSGRGEFGARALGNRSILANASQAAAVRTINEMIKCRDFWMPFAPSVLAERSHEYFHKPKPFAAPFMIMAFDSREQKRADICAAIHPYDFTGRPQEVCEHANPDYYRLLKYFQEMTGAGLILNTSFNLHGEPVVCSPEDALKVFDQSGLQYLAMGSLLLSKT
jgi:carbamoyltransferase